MRGFATRCCDGYDVEVATTCAVDHHTWRNELPAGVEREGDVHRAPLRGHASAAATRPGTSARATSAQVRALSASVWSEPMQRFLLAEADRFDAILLAPVPVRHHVLVGRRAAGTGAARALPARRARGAHRADARAAGPACAAASSSPAPRRRSRAGWRRCARAAWSASASTSRRLSIPPGWPSIRAVARSRAARTWCRSAASRRASASTLLVDLMARLPPPARRPRPGAGRLRPVPAARLGEAHRLPRRRGQARPSWPGPSRRCRRRAWRASRWCCSRPGARARRRCPTPPAARWPSTRARPAAGSSTAAPARSPPACRRCSSPARASASARRAARYVLERFSWDAVRAPVPRGGRGAARARRDRRHAAGAAADRHRHLPARDHRRLRPDAARARDRRAVDGRPHRDRRPGRAPRLAARRRAAAPAGARLVRAAPPRQRRCRCRCSSRSPAAPEPSSARSGSTRASAPACAARSSTTSCRCAFRSGRRPRPRALHGRKLADVEALRRRGLHQRGHGRRRARRTSASTPARVRVARPGVGDRFRDAAPAPPAALGRAAVRRQPVHARAAQEPRDAGRGLRAAARAASGAGAGAGRLGRLGRRRGGRCGASGSGWPTTC